MRYVILLCTLLVGPAAADGGSAWTSPLLQDTEIGIFCHNLPFDAKAAAGTEAGWIAKPIALPKLQTGQETLVPGVLNMAFGIRARGARGTDIWGAEIRVFKPGKTRPETWSGNFRANLWSMNYWYFGSPDQIIPGLWRFEAVAGDDLLFRVEFAVVAPDKAPQLAQRCK